MTSFHLVLQEALRDLELSLLRKEGRVCRALSGDAGAGKQCPRRGQARAEQGLGVWHRRRSRRLWCRASLEPPGCCMRSRSRCHYAQGPLLAGGEPKVLGASAARPSRPGHTLDCILECSRAAVSAGIRLAHPRGGTRRRLWPDSNGEESLVQGPPHQHPTGAPGWQAWKGVGTQQEGRGRMAPPAQRGGPEPLLF